MYFNPFDIAACPLQLLLCMQPKSACSYVNAGIADDLDDPTEQCWRLVLCACSLPGLHPGVHCATGMEVVAAGAHDAAPTTTDAGYEMVVGGNADGGGGRILGHRQFARYYRQKYRAGDPRRSMAAVSSVLSQCGPLPLPTSATCAHSASSVEQVQLVEAHVQSMSCST